MTRVLVTGDREYKDAQRIRETLESLGPGDVIIEGMAPGADTLAGHIARQLGCELLEFPARWGQFGAAAGNIRNEQMLNEGTPDCVHAFHDDITKSRGTADMIRLALRAKLPVWLHHQNGGSLVQWIVVPTKKSGHPVRIGLS